MTNNCIEPTESEKKSRKAMTTEPKRNKDENKDS